MAITMHKRTCQWCKKEFKTKDNRRGKGKFCSVSCKGAYGRSLQDTSGEGNPNWKGGRSFDHRNYDHLRKKWSKRNPKAKTAHRLVASALKSGKLKKEPCSACGISNDIHAHHEDYERPLDVVWMCRSCHQKYHAGTL